jgi:Protein of unknown function (DUF1571)
MRISPYKLIGILSAIALFAIIGSSLFRSPQDESSNGSRNANRAVARPIPETDENSPKNEVVLADESTSDSGNPELEKKSHPLDAVLDVARQSLDHLRKHVDDYTGIIVKRERIQGALGDETKMEFKIRSRREFNGHIRPLSVYMKFLEPRSARNREVIWTEGKKIIGHEGGFANLVRLELEPTGMLAMMGNKYPITELGLMRLVEKLIEKGERDRALGDCEVHIQEDQLVGDRKCRMIQVTHSAANGKFDFHIARIYLDMERMIPLKYTAYLWPKTPAEPPPLEEEFTYLDLKINVGLKDIDFDPDNKDYNYP